MAASALDDSFGSIQAVQGWPRERRGTARMRHQLSAQRWLKLVRKPTLDAGNDLP